MAYRWFSFFLVVFIPSFLWGAPSPDGVVVVANSSDPDSLAIARYYMKKRAIPEENLILLTTSKSEDISWDEFLQTMFNPLREKLFADGWIEGSVSSELDNEGRFKVVTLGGKLDFLVLCRMPLRIQNDKARVQASPVTPPQNQFKTNAGSTDGELSLLGASNTPTIGFVPNPLFGQLNPPTIIRQQVVKVARLDGPTVQAATTLVDRALEAEEKGLRGRAYMDLGGPHQKGDAWMQEAGEQLEALDFPTTWDRKRPLMDFTERFDAPAIYFGWWVANINGPARERDFQFPTGAIGWHLHSFSANSLRRDNFRWTGPLVQRGLTATVGNVFEPYLELTHRPQGFIEALSAGQSVGDAAYYSLPALSWMAVFVGDPLYQPFKVDLEEQLKQIESGKVRDDLSQYSVIREMKRLENEVGKTPALAYGQKQFNKAPGIALGYAIAELAKEQGRREDAIEALAFVAQLPPIFDTNQLGLVYQSNALLWSLGARDDAFKIMQSLMNSPLPEAARRSYLPTAIQQASAVGKMTQLSEWTQQQREFALRDKAAADAKKNK